MVCPFHAPAMSLHPAQVIKVHTQEAETESPWQRKGAHGKSVGASPVCIGAREERRHRDMILGCGVPIPEPRFFRYILGSCSIWPFPSGAVVRG